MEVGPWCGKGRRQEIVWKWLERVILTTVVKTVAKTRLLFNISDIKQKSIYTVHAILMISEHTDKLLLANVR